MLPLFSSPFPISCCLFPFQTSCKIFCFLSHAHHLQSSICSHPANFTPSNLLQRLLTVARFQQILGIHFHLLYLRYLPVISPSAFCQSMTLKSSLPELWQKPAHYSSSAPQAIWLCEVLNEEVYNEHNLNYMAPNLLLYREGKRKLFLNFVGLTTAENLWPTSKNTQFLPSDAC